MVVVGTGTSTTPLEMMEPVALGPVQVETAKRSTPIAAGTPLIVIEQPAGEQLPGTFAAGTAGAGAERATPFTATSVMAIDPVCGDTYKVLGTGVGAAVKLFRVVTALFALAGTGGIFTTKVTD
ncbi:MAG: hypothetical protein JO195_08585 [Candidatus Eremiobacteraeota bacterium]|nr:hypothetical protein [Candidatus Eremiobacteraeota bacterium]